MVEQQDQSASIVDAAVEEGGAYEIIRKRLDQQGRALEEKTKQLNDKRLEEFGSAEMSVAARVRVRTENNCVARDVVQVGELLLFGYNVFIGLKSETKIEDVFSLFRIKEDESGELDFESVPTEGTFLDQPSFVNDFRELYAYYKNARLVELTIYNDILLAAFQIGEQIEDVRVFRWTLTPDGKQAKYMDNRGERDIQLAPRYDFEWTEVTREFTVHGKHPHFNINDAVFVETVGGDLTIKVENNTDDGLGIYREPVEEPTQSLDDADVAFAVVGALILLKIRPYREEQWRYLIFNKASQEVLRVDAIGQSCVQLPEDHGIIFPGGFYLQTGEFKKFDDNKMGLRYKRSIKSPNGEDILYVFYEPESGSVGLFPYNMINKELQNPVYGNGYALSENGRLVIFSAEGEPTRIHPMQIWETQYVSTEFASKIPASQNFFGRVGNAELVRGISELYSVCRMVGNQRVSSHLYEDLSATSRRMFDSYYWIEDSEAGGINEVLKQITDTSELVLDEFEKVESIRQQATAAMKEAESGQKDILQKMHPDSWKTPEEYVDALDTIRHQRGHLMTIRGYRYIDLERIGQLDTELKGDGESLNQVSAHIDLIFSKNFSKDEYQIKRADVVGPAAGSVLRKKGFLALFYALLVILIYVAVRFDSRYAPGAVIALFHDSLLIVGIFIITGKQFDLTILAAILALIGYSNNDTIIVFDRVRETIHLHPKLSIEDAVNRAINDTLGRTIVTSLTTFFVVTSLWVFGGAVIENFAFTLMCGVVIGTYSSVFIASSLVVFITRFQEGQKSKVKGVKPRKHFEVRPEPK